MPVFKDRVLEKTVSTGTASITLNGETDSTYRIFSAAISGVTVVDYAIYHTSADEFETGRGTVNGSVMTRDTVFSSSNSGSLVNFSSGTKKVILIVSSQTLTDGSLTQRSFPVHASAMVPATTSGCGVGSYEVSGNSFNYDTIEFDTGSDEYADFIYTMPTNYSGGNISARFIWTADSGNVSTSTVKFGVAARALADGQDMNLSFPTRTTVTDTYLGSGYTHISDYATGIAISGSASGSTPVMFKVSRDTTDNVPVDAKLIMMEILY